MDSAIFCTNCGTKLVVAEEMANAASVEEMQNEMRPEAQPESEQTGAEQEAQPESQDYQPGNASYQQGQDYQGGANPAAGSAAKKFSGKALGIIIAAVAALIVIICVAVNAKKTINLDEFVTITAEGYDGFGDAYIYVDWDAIYEKYNGKISYTSQGKSELGFFEDLVSPVYALGDYVSVSLDKSYDLSNGDVLTYTWNVNEEYAQYIKCNLKFTDGTYTVGGLETTQTFDAFSGLTVNFEGTSPNGYVEFEYNGDKLSSGDFYCEDAAGLKNGDEIVVSLYQQEASYYVNNYGMIPESLNKTYTVSGLDEYVEDFSDISEDAVSELKSESEDIITAYAAQNFNDENSLKDLEYAGYVINTAKTPEDAYTYNMLFIIYKGDVTNSEGEFSKTTVYYPVAFTNVVSSEGGDVDYETGGEIYGYSYIGGTSYSTTGYTDPYTCYMNIATAYADDYNLASGDGFEAYSEYEDIEKLSDISKSYKKTLQEDAKDRIESYASSEYDGMLKFKKYSVAGEYLLVAKDLGTDFASNNKYVIVYSVKVSSTNDSFKGTKTLYVPVQYDGLIKMGDDDYMVSAVEGILGKSGVEYERYYYTSESIGYADQEDMFNEIISANRDNYTYSVSGDLKDYGK